MYLKTFLTVIILYGFVFSIQATVPSPRASVALICHTSYASDCYPKLFQPTTSFQVVRPFQQLPAGLHVRMNLDTGRKEAKLNIGRDKKTSEKQDLAVVAESNIPIEDCALPTVHGQKVSGSVQLPCTLSQRKSERELFSSYQAVLKSSDSLQTKHLRLALTGLKDLSHDIHWGITLMKDHESVRILLQLIGSQSPRPEAKRAAVLTIGTAIQNNPEALSSLLSHCYTVEIPTGPLEAVIAAFIEKESQLSDNYVFLLSGLCQDQGYCVRFVDANGLDILIRVFDAARAGEWWNDKLRAKIANFLLDRFLHFETPELVNQEGAHYGVLQSQLEPYGASLTSACGIMAQRLKPWCLAFTQSLLKWDSKRNETQSSAAADSVRDAYGALQRRLEACGCNCEEDCMSSREIYPT
ncbi:hypothetical protein MMC24_002257 [Lignoscripta atroalba]|nr:hypothetical protein [Lignoscripta atroalba]